MTTTKQKRRTAPEIIGMHLCCDMRDVSDKAWEKVGTYYGRDVYRVQA